MKKSTIVSAIGVSAILCGFMAAASADAKTVSGQSIGCSQLRGKVVVAMRDGNQQLTATLYKRIDAYNALCANRSGEIKLSTTERRAKSLVVRCEIRYTELQQALYGDAPVSSVVSVAQTAIDSFNRDCASYLMLMGIKPARLSRVQLSTFHQKSSSYVANPAAEAMYASEVMEEGK